MMILRKKMVWVSYWYFLNKVFKTEKKGTEKFSPFANLVFFHYEKFDYIKLSSALYLDKVKIFFRPNVKKPPSFCCI